MPRGMEPRAGLVACERSPACRGIRAQRLWPSVRVTAVGLVRGCPFRLGVRPTRTRLGRGRRLGRGADGGARTRTGKAREILRRLCLEIGSWFQRLEKDK